MHFRAILNIETGVLAVLAGALALCGAASWGYGDADWGVFMDIAAGTGLVSAGLYAGSRRGTEIAGRDGFLVVVIGWGMASALGALPFVLTGTTASVTDAMFESVSGFTTTGSSILEDYSTLTHGILLWRSLTQWFGGMGIIVLMLVILPALGVGGMQLYMREASGPYSEKLTPRLRDTASALWSVYALLTAVEAILLTAWGMDWFDAVNHAMTTMATGGFGTKADSIASYGPAVRWTIIVFMYLGSVNFALHYRALTRRNFGAYVRSDEWRFYTAFVLLACAAMAVYLVVSQGKGWGYAVLEGTFQVVSIVTTTGFATADYVQWGPWPQMLLLFLMILGGCAGSTSGGMKWIRVVVTLRALRLELLQLVHPYLLMEVKLDRRRVAPDVQKNIFIFLALYVATWSTASLALTLDGNSIATAFGSVASAMSGVGPGLHATGPANTYFPLSAWDKWVLVFAMLAGRLEMMTLYVLALPSLWRG